MIDVHQCPRCELRFTNRAELRDHFEHDHHADPETFDRYRYPGRSTASQPGRRVLLVANQTLQDDHVIDAVRQRARDGDRLVVLVPATHSANLASPPSRGAAAAGHDDAADDVGLAMARWRLRTTIERLREAGADVEGRIGHPNPVTAVARTLEEVDVDEIVLSTLPVSISRWVQADLPTRLQRRFGIPVTVLTPAPTGQ